MAHISPDIDVATGTLAAVSDDTYRSTLIRVHDLGGAGWWNNPVSVDPTLLVVSSEVGSVCCYETSGVSFLAGTCSGPIRLYGSGSLALAVGEYEWTIDGEAVSTYNEAIPDLLEGHEYVLEGQLSSDEPVTQFRVSRHGSGTQIGLYTV